MSYLHRFLKITAYFAVVFFLISCSSEDNNRIPDGGMHGDIVEIFTIQGNVIKKSLGVRINSEAVMIPYHAVTEMSPIYVLSERGEIELLDYSDLVRFNDDIAILKAGVLDFRDSIKIKGLANTIAIEGGYRFIGVSPTRVIDRSDLWEFDSGSVIACPLPTRAGDSGGVLIGSGGELHAMLIGKVGPVALFSPVADQKMLGGAVDHSLINQNSIEFAIDNLNDLNAVPDDHGSVLFTVQQASLLVEEAYNLTENKIAIARLDDVAKSIRDQSLNVWLPLIDDFGQVLDAELAESIVELIESSVIEITPFSLESIVMELISSDRIDLLDRVLAAKSVQNTSMPCQSQERMAIVLAYAYSDHIQEIRHLINNRMDSNLIKEWRLIVSHSSRLASKRFGTQTAAEEIEYSAGCFDSESWIELLNINEMRFLVSSNKWKNLYDLASVKIKEKYTVEKIEYATRGFIESGMSDINMLLSLCTDDSRFEGAVVAIANGAVYFERPDLIRQLLQSPRILDNQELSIRLAARLLEVNDGEAASVEYVIDQMKTHASFIALAKDYALLRGASTIDVVSRELNGVVDNEIYLLSLFYWFKESSKNASS